MVGDEGDQRNVPGPLNGGAERPLVFSAHAGAAAGLDLGPVGNEPPDPVDFLVIDVLDVLDAEGADPAAGSEPPAGPPARPPSRSASSLRPRPEAVGKARLVLYPLRWSYFSFSSFAALER